MTTLAAKSMPALVPANLDATLDRRIGHAAFRVLIAMARHADGDGIARVNVNELADELGISYRALRDHMSSLETRGYVVTERRGNVFRMVY